MQTHIFMGVVYYQRLRHMVADKAQVRALGPSDPTTRQPVKGRQRHGGIRLGEMERDALVAHGTAFLVHDRLMRCSDYSLGFVCPCCGSIITPVPKQESGAGSAFSANRTAYSRDANRGMISLRENRDGLQYHGGGGTSFGARAITTAICPPCSRKARQSDPNAKDIECVAKDIPFVYRLLTVEFAAMGINLQMKLTDPVYDAYRSGTTLPRSGEQNPNPITILPRNVMKDHDDDMKMMMELQG